MSIFEMIGQISTLSDVYNQYKKIIKALVEHTNFQQHFTNYIERFTAHLDKLQGLIGPPLYMLESFDFEEKEYGKEVLPAD